MKKILITGFEPFGGEDKNPSFEAIKSLNNKYNDITLIKKEIPVLFHESISLLDQYIKEQDPDAIICVGQAGGRFGITPERVAINIDDARIPDNNEVTIIDKPIFEDGKTAYFSSLPIKKLVDSMKKEGIPSDLSNSAGTYVCNHLMYGVLYLIEKKYPNKIGGFIHVPFASYQVTDKRDVPSMSIDDIIKGLSICVENVFENEPALKMGATH